MALERSSVTRNVVFASTMKRPETLLCRLSKIKYSDFGDVLK
jgi:hypothetical protein